MPWRRRALASTTLSPPIITPDPKLEYRLALIAALLFAWGGDAWAYRPFDGTDASVAAPGEAEIELEPIGLAQQGAQRTFIAPAITLNYGFAPGWEAAIEGDVETPLGAGRSSIASNGAFLKTVLREGCLQDKIGPSLATQFGVLLPELNGEAGTGGTIAVILSQQWRWLTLHLNAAAALTRQQHGDLFLDAIVEGPRAGPVRPVLELGYERDYGRSHTLSGLIGAIWQLRDNLAIDFGLRGTRLNNRETSAIRAGLTVAFPVP